MNLKSYRALQIENPEAAMIFDLTERFPAGRRASFVRRTTLSPVGQSPSLRSSLVVPLGMTSSSSTNSLPVECGNVTL